MAAVVVAADNNRRAVATAATDAGTWGNDGGGGGVSDEPDLLYQGTTAQSRKVSTSWLGRSYDDNVTTDMTVAGREHVIFKINVTNYGALVARTAPGAAVKIGSGSAAYYEYQLFGSAEYPAAGGFQFVPIDPNISGYRDATIGSPVLTAVDYFSFGADFSATSKSENVIIDAIDIGRGLKLTGGDGADTDGVWDDFISADEGTTTNRWGYVRTLDGIMFCIGELSIGENTSETAVATVFQDATGQVLVWENGRVSAGFHRFRVNLGNAATDIDITGATFDSVGESSNTVGGLYTATGEDTRLAVEATGTSGDAKFIGCAFKNLSDMTLTSAVTLDDCDVTTASMTMSGAEIFDSVIRTTSAANAAALTDPTFGTTTDLRNTEFVQAGSGHALELNSGNTSPTYTLSGVTFTGYAGSDGSAGNEAIYVSDTTGTVTLNIVGGSTPSIRTAGATVAVNNSRTVTFNGMADDTQVVIRRVSDDVELHVDGDVGPDGSTSYTYDATAAGTNVELVIVSLAEEPLTVPLTLPSESQTFTIVQSNDRVYDNP